MIQGELELISKTLRSPLIFDRLPDIIAKYSHKKPMMVFCFTRKSCISTARLLANLWATRAPKDRLWPGPTFKIVVQDPELKSRQDLVNIRGDINVIQAL